MTPQSSFAGKVEGMFALLRDFASVAVAHVGNHGTLLEANSAFQALVGTAAGQGSVAAQFLNPTFEQLIAAPAGADQCIHNGTLKIGRDAQFAMPMRGVAYRVQDGIMVVAELAEMAHLTAAVSTLRSELAGRDYTINRMTQELERQKRAIDDMMVIDPLTGLPNRRRLEEALDGEIERARRYRTPLSVVMSDLDQLDEVNHEFGREIGDSALRRFGQVIANVTRRSDLPARYTGATFLTVLPNSGVQGAVIFAERVRSQISTVPLPPLDRSMTASFGVTEFRDSDSITALLERADAALRQAKNAGRNRVLASA